MLFLDLDIWGRPVEIEIETGLPKAPFQESLQNQKLKLCRKRINLEQRWESKDNFSIEFLE